MNALTHDFPASRTGAAACEEERLAAQWAAVQDAGEAVAALAGVAPEPRSAQAREFAAAIRAVGGWRQELARTGIDDLAAMMRPGVEALLSVAARGQDPTPAAQALWREYDHARAALLALIPDLADEPDSDG